MRGDIYALLFRMGHFAYVYCLGVLQHTPDVAKAFAALPPMVGPGGRHCVDVYERTWKTALLPRFWLRPVTRRMSNDRLFSVVERLVPRLLPLSRALSRIPVFGHVLHRLVPVANSASIYTLRESQHLEWSLLDNFDWLSPEYDSPQTRKVLNCWMEEAGLDQPEVFKAGALVGRGVRQHAP